MDPKQPVTVAHVVALMFMPAVGVVVLLDARYSPLAFPQVTFAFMFVYAVAVFGWAAIRKLWKS